MHKNYPNIVFEDYPEFTPNLTPREMFELGSFGGTYWRPIYSSIVNKHLSNQHRVKKHNIDELFKGLSDDILTRTKQDIKLNKYGVKAGSSLHEWESNGWITKHDPYGWVQWYANFYNGRRIPEEDERQISRWRNFAGPTGRFRRRLISLIIKNDSTWSDESISPVIRQGLQHWAYILTKEDFDTDLKSRNSKK